MRRKRERQGKELVEQGLLMKVMRNRATRGAARAARRELGRVRVQRSRKSPATQRQQKCPASSAAQIPTRVARERREESSARVPLRPRGETAAQVSKPRPKRKTRGAPRKLGRTHVQARRWATKPQVSICYGHERNQVSSAANEETRKVR